MLLRNSHPWKRPKSLIVNHTAHFGSVARDQQRGTTKAAKYVIAQELRRGIPCRRLLPDTMLTLARLDRSKEQAR